jgi:hypothetical protein
MGAQVDRRAGAGRPGRGHRGLIGRPCLLLRAVSRVDRRRPGAKYLHLVTNNTVEGTQFRALPQAGVPVIADMSSDLMTDTFDPSACDMAYAHTQYRTHAAHGSNYHTPPTFSLYVTWLMLLGQAAINGEDRYFLRWPLGELVC